jgi:hypothetical protein
MTTVNLSTKTTLTFKQLMTIADVLKAERRVQAQATFAHDQIVKASLKDHPQKLDYLVGVQQANYDRKQDLDHAFYAIEEMIREFN